MVIFKFRVMGIATPSPFGYSPFAGGEQGEGVKQYRDR